MKAPLGETSLARSKLVIHDESRTISKQKPKIRVIHVVAPQIIKTDVKNFRELVQKLTGQPSERRGNMIKGNGASSQMIQPKPHGSNHKKNIQSASTHVLHNTHRMKKESDAILLGGENSNAFLSFLRDVDGSIHDMNEFPLFPFRSAQMNTFSKMPLC
ncbi:hypothetical protein CDL12_16843 [Handroanthus impetiginosus]|uniref:VQ domain-containing protein n=1 Tax=Handroanthus impetiginosus TaxID=429701 RepID=A0A2G9GZ92_9LAMI|nr:hypothetical protein CDL12_16843 [Handroanthus impetiginosus]